MFLRHLHTEFMSLNQCAMPVRNARACGKYQDFVDRRMLLTNKLLSQGYRRAKLESESSVRDIMIPLMPMMWPFLISSKPIPDLMASIEA